MGSAIIALNHMINTSFEGYTKIYIDGTGDPETDRGGLATSSLRKR